MRTPENLNARCPVAGTPSLSRSAWCALVALACAAAACGGDDTVIGPDIAGGGDVSADANADGTIDTGGGDTTATDDAADTSSVDDTSETTEDTSGPTDDAVDPDTGASDDAVDPDTGASDDAVDPDTGASDDAVDPDTGASDDAVAPDGGPTCKTDDDCSAATLLAACQVAVCDAGTCKAKDAPNGDACDDGSACTDKDACQAGSCVGVSKACDDGNPCTSDACDDASGKCANAPVADGGSCDDGDPCSDKDACAEGKCKGTAKVCSDDNPCTDDACTADAGCTHTPNNGPCGDSNKCFAGGQCKDGACVGGSAVACDDGNPCTDDACGKDSGLCVYTPHTKPCDDGDKCSLEDACKDGKCLAAKQTACDDGDPCTDDTCDKSNGQCAFAAKTDGVACSDGDACTDADACKAGACKGGAAKVCNDGNPCTDDACDGKTGCTAKNNAAPCSGDACKLGTCSDGACKLGDKTGCDDGNPCTTDTCDSKANKCVFAAAVNGTVCGDGSACVEKSTCQKGVCEVGAKVDCDDANPCTDDTCDAKTGCKWSGNKAPCDDGDKCTAGDACNNGGCAKGTAIDVAKVCNDNNPCTDETCDPKAGCSAKPNTAACDDSNICTDKDICKDGKCQGAGAAKCDDGKPCTNDLCDAKTGDCSWSANTGACDDGDPCTDKDACANGKCGGSAKVCDDKNACTSDTCDAKTGACVFAPIASDKPLACDDGSKCTKDDVCKAGQCVGGGAPTCDDGNACTDDLCDPATGACSFGPNTKPCDTGDKCSFGDTCKNGKCLAGAGKSCDDGTACTDDSCDSATGACKFTPVKDGTACQDGQECTTKEACAAGKCVAGDTAACALFSDTFECAAAGKGWALDAPQGKNVKWAVDQTPAGVGAAQFGCNLNFNDGTDYCDVTGGSGQWVQCQSPTGNATSPVVDASKLGNSVRIRFNVYYDLDMCAQAQTDRPQVQLMAETGDTVLYSWIMQKTDQSQQWRLETRVVPEVKGKKFRVRYNLYNPSGQCSNAGKGYFVDNLIIDEQPSPEVCGDSIDNDKNGLTDCADAACKGNAACAEVCDDGKDNDLDDTIDCKDSDCAKAIACTSTVLWSQTFDCGAAGWNYAAMNQAVVWAIDGTPAAVKPVTGACTINFNNGTNLCGTGAGCTSNNTSNAAAGMATWSKKIDATGYTKLYVTYWSYIDAEPLTQQTQNYDRAWIQASTDNFATCCGATTQCPQGTSNTCNTNGTGTYLAPREAAQQKTWTKVTVDLAKFAGKQFDLRLRFSTGDGQNNAGAGWFVDDLTLYGSK